jgi:PPM family protein phosphatase
MKLNAAGKSDIGMKRKLNEDSLLMSPGMGLYVVADGMGGHKAGEIASRIVVDTIKDYWMKINKNEHPSFIEPITKDIPDRAKHLVNSISLANRVIYEAQQQPQYHGMGSTVSSLLVDKNRLWSANVGDSRVYLLTGGKLKIVSEEHSVEAEQKNLGLYDSNGSTNPFMKNLLTRALGLNEKVDTFITAIEPEPGDIILACSDGLTNYMSEESIVTILENASLSVEQKVDALINAANEGGGGDNITVILLEILDEGGWARLKNRLRLQ